MKPETPKTLPTIVEKGEIVLYQPDESIRLEVRIEDETVWLTQQQIADLFGTKRPAITKHLNNIFKCGELDENSVSSILEHTAAAFGMLTLSSLISSAQQQRESF